VYKCEESSSFVGGAVQAESGVVWDFGSVGFGGELGLLDSQDVEVF